jgi:hypothetical protein
MNNLAVPIGEANNPMLVKQEPINKMPEANRYRKYRKF